MSFEFQEKVYDEIYNVLGDSDQTITIEDTTKLVYLEQVLRETLRLYPVGPLLLRQLQDDVKIGEQIKKKKKLSTLYEYIITLCA